MLKEISNSPTCDFLPSFRCVARIDTDDSECDWGKDMLKNDRVFA